MAPDILLIGDEARRSNLAQQIRTLGHQVELCKVEDVGRRLQAQPFPAVVIVCAADGDAQQVMAKLRELPGGTSTAVILYGMGQPDHDLADVLDLGADHFVEEGSSAEDLAMVLHELAPPTPADGAALGEPGHAEDVTERPPGLSGRTEVIEAAGDERASPVAVDPNIGRLHRTLDILEARLRAREQEHADLPDDGDDVELARIGLEDVPEVEGEGEGDFLAPGDSHDRMSVARLSSLGDDAAESSERPPWASRAHDTVLLGHDAEVSDPETGYRQVGSSAHSPPVREVQGFSAGLEGRLEAADVPRLLWRLHRAEFTGKLGLLRGRVRKEVWLAAGDVVFVRSNLSRDRLVDHMLRRGLLTRAQYETARRMAAKEPRRAGQILMDAGFVKPGEFHDVLRHHLVTTVQSLFPWGEGEWGVEPDVTCEEPIRIDMAMPELIVSGLRSTVGAAQLRQRIGSLERRPRMTAAVRTVPGGLHGLALELRLSPAQEAWLAKVDARRPLRVLLTEFEGEDEDALSLIQGLVIMGLMELLDEPEAENRADPVEIDRKRIVERLATVRQADYYQVLGLHRDATQKDVRRAHAELMRTFSDDTLEAETRRELAEELFEIRAALAEATQLLSDDVLRAAYLAHLEDD